MMTDQDDTASQAALKPLLGISSLLRLVNDQGDVMSVWNELMARIDSDPFDAAALMDMSVLLQANGRRDKGLEIQKMAISLTPVFKRIHGNGQGLQVIAFVTAGDMMANTPIDFLLEGSDFTLYFVYVDAGTAALPELPACDAAFMGVGESAQNRAVLVNLRRLLTGWQGPKILNMAPEKISVMTRDEVNAQFTHEPSILAPVTLTVSRDALGQIIKGEIPVGALLSDTHFPLIIRPVDTQGGQGLEKIDDVAGLEAYLGVFGQSDFYIAPFIDYSLSDGLFRKQRIVFIGGKAFASHYAISEHWMVHYLSASMSENPERRAEEADWMQNFDDGFARRHATAFAALNRYFDLDYFGIDCAETQDGRLLLFEADVAMLVHDMDSEAVFPYKKPAMRKLFGAFQDLFKGASGSQA
jgi:hypothetical protein